MSTLDLETQIANLERRIAGLETLCFGSVRSGPDARQVISLYVEITRILAQGKLPVEAVKGWAHACSTLSEVSLLQLGRDVEDPTPWVPFLKLLIALREAGHESEVAAAEAHLRELAGNLLKIQGLDLVEPDDALMRARPGPGEALSV